MSIRKIYDQISQQIQDIHRQLDHATSLEANAFKKQADKMFKSNQELWERYQSKTLHDTVAEQIEKIPFIVLQDTVKDLLQEINIWQQQQLKSATETETKRIVDETTKERVVSPPTPNTYMLITNKLSTTTIYLPTVPSSEQLMPEHQSLQRIMTLIAQAAKIKSIDMMQWYCLRQQACDEHNDLTKKMVIKRQSFRDEIPSEWRAIVEQTHELIPLLPYPKDLPKKAEKIFQSIKQKYEPQIELQLKSLIDKEATDRYEQYQRTCKNATIEIMALSEEYPSQTKECMKYNVVLQNKLSRCYEEQGLYSEAIKHAEFAIKISEKHSPSEDHSSIEQGIKRLVFLQKMLIDQQETPVTETELDFSSTSLRPS